MLNLGVAPHVRELIVNVSGRTFAHKPEGGQVDNGDQVRRLSRFKIEHPEWQVISPKDIRSVLRGETEWRAEGPGGHIARAMELSDLLDELEGKR